MQLTSTYINRHLPSLPYRMNERECHSIEDLLAIYGPHGMVRKLVTYLGQAGGMPVYVGHCDQADFDFIARRLTGLSSLTTGLRQALFAGGKGQSLPGMTLSSIAESVERFLGALAFFQYDQVICTSHRDMVRRGYTALGPADIPLFAEEQYASGELLYERFTPDTPVGWIEGRRLLSGEKVWAPAQLIALFYGQQPGETVVGYATSGGLATHIDEQEALFHGITELIERDAVNLYWNCRMPPRRIEIDRPPRRPELARFMREAAALPGNLEFYLHTVDFPEVPVITVMETSPWLARYSYCAGGGVDVDLEQAMLQAFTEYGQSERSLRLALAAPERSLAHAIHRIFDVGEDAPAEKIDIFFKIVSFYGYPKNRRKLAWYLDDGQRVKLSALTAGAPDYGPRAAPMEYRWARLMEALRRQHIDPLVFDFTPPQMRQLKLMKVFIPELVSPYIHSNPLLGHPRYYEVPQRLGAAKGRLGFEDLVKDPLPYP